MLVVLTVFLTFILTTLYITNKYNLGQADISTLLNYSSTGNNLSKTINNIQKIQEYYYLNDIDEEATKEGAIKGYVAALGDPYTEYITKEEMHQLYSYDLSKDPALERQRDIFIFQCLVGCRVSDLMNFTADNITDNILSYVPQKTKDESPRIVRVPLIPYAQELIKKYAGADKKGRLFPFISSQKYNDNIKKIVKACGIDRMVIVRNSLTGNNEAKPIHEVASSHMASRTFIGGLYEGIKDPNIIAKMSGHVEGSKAFNRYRDISDNTLKDALKNIDF